MRKNIIWWAALAVFAAAALFSGLQNAHQNAARTPDEGPETLGDYVVRTCANGPEIVKAVHAAAVARGAKANTQYALSSGAAREFNQCAKVTPDPLTRDWSIWNYAFWLAASAPHDAQGLPVLESSARILAHLGSQTTYPVVKNGANELRTGTDKQIATLKASLAKGSSASSP